jgi:hypothetical protein
LTCTYRAKRLCELSSTKTGSYPHECLCLCRLLGVIIRKQPRTKETRRCLIFFLPVKHSLYTRIALLYYSYIPWPTKWTYSVKRLLMCEIICGRKITCMTQTKILTKTTQIWGFSKLRVRIKKYYTDLLHFSTRIR